MSDGAYFVTITIGKKDGTAIVKEYENRIFELWKPQFPCSSVPELFTTLGSCFIDDKGIEEIGELECVDDISFVRIDQSDIVWGEDADFVESDYDNVEYDEESDMVIGTNTFFFVIRDGNLVYVEDMPETECSGDFGREDQCAIDFNGKAVVLTGFEEDEPKLISKIKNSGGIIRNSVSRKTDYLIYNPEYIPGYTVKLRQAMYLALKGAPIKIFVCTDVLKLAFKEFQFPPEFETKTEVEVKRTETGEVIILDREVLVSYNGCEENVVVPDGIERIAGGAFHGQSFIKSLELPDSVRVVNALPANLENLILPSYLESINLQYTSFQNLVSISTKHCDNKICAIDNCLLDKSEEYYRKTLFDYVTGQHVTVQWVNEGTTKLNCELIKGCINSIIPDYVSHIGVSAFSHCRGLKTFRLPKELKIIDGQAFDNCTELEEIYVPEGVEIIESYAFCWCSSLKSVFLPASLILMGEGVFSGCENVTLYIKTNSYAEKYAQKAKLHYEYY